MIYFSFDVYVSDHLVCSETTLIQRAVNSQGMLPNSFDVRPDRRKVSIYIAQSNIEYGSTVMSREAIGSAIPRFGLP